MHKLMIAVVAGTFAAAAVAQTSTPPATDAKAKQDMVKSATEGTAKGHGAASAEGSAKVAQTKDAPKALPDTASKQQAVNSATATNVSNSGKTSAEGSAKAAADKSKRKAKPKPKLDSPEMKEASKP